jgi:hypothetical protein
MRLDMTTLTSVQFSVPADEPATSTTRPTRWLALGAVAGPLLFTFAWSVLGLLSPGYTLFDTLIAPYSPISQPVSGLGLGPTGPFMNAAFVLSGLLLAAGVLGGVKGIEGLGTVQRWSCALLLLLSPLGARRRVPRQHPTLAAIRQLAVAGQPGHPSAADSVFPDVLADR